MTRIADPRQRGEGINRREIFYEFKSVKDVPPKDFNKQFFKDLSNGKITSLDQIKWIFDGKKNPTGKGTDSFEKAMKDAIEGLELNDNLAKKFLNDSKATADDLKDALKNRYKEIFIISKK